MKGARGDENPNWLLNCAGAAAVPLTLGRPVRDPRAVPSLSPCCPLRWGCWRCWHCGVWGGPILISVLGSPAPQPWGLHAQDPAPSAVATGLRGRRAEARPR